MEDAPLKNPSELTERLGLKASGRVLLVDAPGSLENLLLARRGSACETRSVEGRSLRAAKETYDAILLWREERAGSQALLEGATKRLEPGGALWVVTATRKVMGPKIPATHRLDLSDLTRALSEGFTHDRQVRVTAWHVAYRFVRR